MKIRRHSRIIGYLVYGLVLIGGVLSAKVSEAATYYVAKTGHDSNTCAQAQSQPTPKQTIRSGLECLYPGDTL